MQTVTDLVREVDEAADKVKELAAQPVNKENEDLLFGHFMLGLAALGQLAALAPAACRTEDEDDLL
jgi:hypothetical protein